MNFNDTAIGWWLGLDMPEMSRQEAQLVALTVALTAARRLIDADPVMRMQGSCYLPMLSCGERLLNALRAGDKATIRAAQESADALWARERPSWRDAGQERADRITAVLGATQGRWLLQPHGSKARASSWCPPHVAAYLQGDLARSKAVGWAAFIKTADLMALVDKAGQEAIWAEREAQRADARRAVMV